MPFSSIKKSVRFFQIFVTFSEYLNYISYFTFSGGINDPFVIQAALLHDTVEDTETTLDEIEKNFGKTVRE